MQVLCVVSSDEQADVVCATCGQKYMVYYSRQSSSECEAALETVRATLIQHHADDVTPDAHPSSVFNVPEWRGHAHMSAAALLSGAPVRPLSEYDALERLAS